MYRYYPFHWRRGSMRRFAFQHLHGTVLDRDERGNYLLLDLSNWVDATLFLEGSFEPNGITAMEGWITRNHADIFLDVGANIGIYSVCIAQNEQVRSIHAFEPDPRNYRQLQANLFLSPNGQKVQAHNVALSDSAGEAELFVSRKTTKTDVGKFNTGTSSLTFDNARHEKSAVARVETRRLDDMISLHGAVIAIKIDVEGHEPAVLAGAQRLLRENTCVLLVEVFEANLSRVDAVLANYGYTPVESFSLKDYRTYAKSAA
jgi:FkbM family methyltransferase